MRTAIYRITRHFGSGLLVLLPVLFLFAVAGQAQSTTGPDSIFQLNGDPGPAPTGGVSGSSSTCDYGGTTGPCDNWDFLNGTTGTNGSAGHSLVRTFINGQSSTESFTTGGSKDTNPIGSWACSSSPTPNKDTLTDGYAAAYKDSVGDFNLVFGADRASPNGDANIGIWFFQQSVTCNPTTEQFSGAHQDGDIFAISAFTGGGGTSTITVYEWDSTDCSGIKTTVKNPSVGSCADTNLKLIATQSSSSECATNGSTCAVTNSATVSTSWDGSVVSPDFFEGGLDIGQLIGHSLPCFSSFLEETRSSQSTSAVLKDFVLGGFDVCGVGVTKACGTATGGGPTVSSDGTTIDYPTHGEVTNAGIGTLYDVQVCDTVGSSTTAVAVTNDTTGSSYNGTSTLGPGDTGSWSNTSSSTSGSLSDTAIAVATSSSTGSSTCGNGTTIPPGPIVSPNPPASATCTYSVSDTLNVTKTCTPGTSLVSTGSDVQVRVGNSGEVCNYGVSQVTGVGLTENDSSSSSPSSVTPSTTTLGPCTSPGTDTTTGNPTCGETCIGLWDVTAGTCAGSDAGNLCTQEGGHDTCIAGNCTTYTSSYTPTKIDSGDGTGPGRYYFNDTITVSSATPAVAGSLTTISGNPVAACNGSYACASASCPICPEGACPAP